MNTALVVIEHDIALLADLSERFIALNQGTVIAQGEPDEVLNNPDRFLLFGVVERNNSKKRDTLIFKGKKMH